MKQLPDPPVVYERPKTRWFENYVPSDNNNTVALNKLLTAMWLMLNDRMMLGIPDKSVLFSANERNTADKMLSLFGDQTMLVWGNQCDKVPKDGCASNEWSKLMFKRWNKGDKI